MSNHTRTERTLYAEESPSDGWFTDATLINDRWVNISQDSSDPDASEWPEAEQHRWVAVTVEQFDIIARALGYER